MNIKYTMDRVENGNQQDHQLKYQHEGDSGVDLRSVYHVVVGAHKSLLIHTGLKIAIPKGYEGQVRPRSGLALKHQITVLNAPGTVDAGYRGEVGVVLINHSDEAFHIKVGDRIAQLVICPVVRGEFELVESLDDETSRGEGGFASTGVK